MKRIFTIIAIAVGLVLPMQAQLKPVTKEITKSSVERSFKKKAAKEASELTVNDLVGTYQANAMSAFQGQPDEAWSMTVTLDETDVNKVWLHPVMQVNGATADDLNPIYATYSQENGTLTIPLGQTLYGGATEQMQLVFATVDADYNPLYEGEITLPVTGTVKNITIEVDMIIGCGNILANEWWYQAYGYTTFTKVAPVPLIYITAKDGASLVHKVQAEQLYFVEHDNDIYVATVPEYTPDAIAGTYEVYATSAFQGYPDEEWTVTITRDEADNNKVWINPIFLFGGLTAEEMTPIYGTFDESTGTLTIPLGQTLYTEPGFTMVLGKADVDNGYSPLIEGNLVLTVYNNNGEKYFEINDVIGAGNLDEGDEGWWYQALGYCYYLGVEPLIAPLSEIGTISREMPEVDLESILADGAYNWSFDFSQDAMSWESFNTKVQFKKTGTVDLGDLFGDGAAGIMADSWTVSGFMEDIGYFEANDGTAAAFNAYNYTFEYEGEFFEVIEMLDPAGKPLTIGSIQLQDQDGTTFTTDVYLGDFDGKGITYAINFVVEDGVAQYGGTQPALWFIMDDNAYLLAYLDEMNITRADAAQAPRKVAKATKINFYEHPIAVKNVAGFKKNIFNK